MKKFTLPLAALAALSLAANVAAQKKGGNRTTHIENRADYQIQPSPLPVGDAGIMWYTTWETALAEAQRSNRPLFFMAAAAECNGISGIF